MDGADGNTGAGAGDATTGSGDDAPYGDTGHAPADTGQPPVRGECFIGLRGPELIVGKGQGVDTCIATFASPDCDYRVEYGVDLSDPFELAESPDFTIEDVAIEEDAARLITAQYRLNSDAYWVGLRIPSFARDPPEYSLTATARCSSLEAQATARAVLQTVDVPHVGEGLCVPVRPNKCTLN